MVDGGGRGHRVLHPGALRGLVGRLPGSGGVAVDRARGAGAELAGEVGRGAGGDATLVGAGQAHQGVDHLVGGLRRDAGRPAERERAAHGEVDDAVHRLLFVGAHRLGGVRALPREQEREGMVDGAGAGGLQEVGGRPDELVDGDVAEPDLGEADGAEAGVLHPRAHAVGGDLDGEVREGALADVDHLPLAGEGGLVEGDVDGVPVVEAELHPGDGAVADAALGLEERQPVGGEGLVELDLEALAFDLGEGPDPPRRLRVAVHGLGGPVPGGVGDGVAVAGGRDGGAALIGDREGVVGGVGEHLEAVVARIVHQGLLAGPFGVALVLTDRAPPAGALAVGVGDDELGVVVKAGLERLGLVLERARVEDGLVDVHEARGGGLHQPVAVAGEEHRPVLRDGPDDGLGVLDRVHRDGGRLGQLGVGAQLDLVDERQRGPGAVGGIGRAEAQGRAEAGRGVHEPVRGPGAGRAVALVGEVRAQHHVADAEEAGDGRHRVGVEGVLLEGPVQGVQQVGGRVRAVGDELAGDVGPVHEPGGDRVDGGAPAVGGEVGTGELEDPCGVVAGVEGGGGLVPVGGDVLGPVQVAVDQVAAPRGGHVGQHEEHRQQPGGQGQAGERPTEGVHAGAQQHGGAEDDEGHGSRGAAEGEAGVQVGEVPEDAPGRRRVGVGVAADADHDAHPDEQHEEGPVAEAGDEGRDEGEDGQPVAEGRAPAHVADAGQDPLAELVVAVEEPVAEAPQQLGGRRGDGDRLIGLGVAQDGDAEAALDGEAGDPPQRGQDREHADAQHGPEGRFEADLTLEEHGPHHPQQRAEADEDQRGGVDGPDGEHHQGEQGRVAPPAVAQRSGGQGHEPGERGPGKQDHRQAGGVGQQVGAEGVRQRGDDQAEVPAPGGPRAGRPSWRQDVPVQRAQQVEHAGTGREEHGAEPEPLGDPVGKAGGVEHPVEGPQGPEVADVLVGDRAEADARVPEEGGVVQEAPGIQVQVGLGVGTHPPGLGEQQGQVGDRGQDQQGYGADQAGGPAGAGVGTVGRPVAPLVARARPSGHRGGGVVAHRRFGHAGREGMRRLRGGCGRPEDGREPPPREPSPGTPWYSRPPE